MAASGDSGEGGLTVVPDGSALIQLANFIFLIIALNFLLYRPIRKILQERKDKIRGFESAIDGCGKSVVEKENAFAKAVKDARAKGLKEKETLVGQAEAEERRLIESINAKAQSDLADIRAKLAVDADRARQSLQDQVEGFANEIAKKILGRAV
jgi:F-type H+-transporting ATPase subunit b